MRRIVKKWGDSLVVTFDKEVQRIIGLKEGDVIRFTITEIDTKEPYKEEKN